MESQIIAEIQKNLYPEAHKAIGNWETFPWHRGSNRQPDTQKINSSQALAIDVFGTIMVHPKSSIILNCLADEFDLPQSKIWKLHLEWISPTNPLREINQHTQVDVLAESDNSLIFFECKFNEHDGGSCSQPNLINSGGHKGLSQCTGNYLPQTNPVNGKVSQCALTAKGIRYWEVIPEVFHFSGENNYVPCPFVGPRYQWMRNITNAFEIARETGRRAAFCLVYADSPGLSVAKMVKSMDWQSFIGEIKQDRISVHAISYQDLLKLVEEVDPSESWNLLNSWINRKIKSVDGG
jgi:hypothetical protein